MNAQNIDQLGMKIREALDLISRLRSEKASLKSDLDRARKSLPEKGGGKVLGRDQARAFTEDLERLQNERMQVKKKIRNIMRRLEGIHLEEGKGQEDLFGPDESDRT